MLLFYLGFFLFFKLLDQKFICKFNFVDLYLQPRILLVDLSNLKEILFELVTSLPEQQVNLFLSFILNFFKERLLAQLQLLHQLWLLIEQLVSNQI